ncbi:MULTISPECIES: 2-oxoglutarate dehydrogenase E1 component [Stenotrophomonas]|uniref:oxoglutarate dehydrogenase (succinyl-transferring) n=1 Tax=Stenotrophomonas acidaminiphila TaxID=128780 RepID=A0A0R0E2U8_9GAMM|nr:MULTISPECIES: 2-oxoglutarate dehydrogenase E1 component [Stenotrophomonas]ALJ28696.1 2-oxoglutarate dehydrogenase E1 component [Stenotrophomonas acidaminiphila]KRG84490.1 2-oxoglutarate dehydrogenase [Stenotrophomonas acidaminiphila]MCA7022622.1 2-oxoglutarate dehydrogenase E1 component [Stenotrophomonas acidaminiphila]MCE4074179.1 2-oxoglutarate dehydrogenase E1 component [Stenotrophomonas acidaminiphila]QOF97275.1 2-oxoglutarate dehydrogenase E1 component [Stenotrophomonas sp. CW117]
MDNLLKQFAQSSQLAGGNASYIEDLYEQYLVSPDSVDPKWKSYFDGFKGREAGDVPHSAVIAHIAEAGRNASSAVAGSGGGDERERNVGRLITAYRSRGHLGAQLDPLGLTPPVNPPDLGLAFHHLSDADLNDEFSTGGVGGQPRMKLRDLLARLKATYTGSIGAEFMYIAEVDQRQWLYQRLENAGGNYNLDADTQRRTLERLTAAEGLERYLHTKYVGQKRFSLEGGDSLIPMMDTVIRGAGKDGVKDVVIGMAHRGRLNVLVNTLGKNPRKLFDEFEGRFEHDDRAVAGDVKYHMGFSADVATAGGPVHLALAFNPSHLEIVDPVVAGSVRSRQERRGDAARKQVMPILIHGDAAFAGQGVVMELFQMSQARGFAVGGTVHIVINNQVGFTTSNRDDSRSTLYCTDIAKMVGAPVLHVNGDDPEAVVFAAQLAYDFRQQFHKDVVIDLVCYRRWGHNEADEPAITQPLMYQVIRKHKTTRELYAEKLEAAGVIPANGGKALVDAYRDKLDSGEVTTELAQVEKTPPTSKLYVDWPKLLAGKLSDPVSTQVPMAELARLAKLINTIPEGVELHSRVAKVYDDRRRMAAGEIPGDWGFAENLAYATLLDQGHGLRLVGQDVGRGTFTHRHAILHDQKTDAYYLPLRQLVQSPEQATIIDSLLSEEAVMAYEYGFSTTDPNTLCIWEGQFGDFANGAQVVIDQFIASGEAKWGRISGLTLLLPHGYEGQGPEHSSARLERFLQLCALENMLVCVPSTPAQAFHMLRRQLCMTTRKPLVVMSPKSLLRHKLAVSTLDELANGEFQHLIGDANADAKKVKRVVLCSGKVYYDLLEDQTKRGQDDVAIIRVEQLYPFPRTLLAAELNKYGKAADVVWCQEEPMNQGAWYQIRHHLQACLADGQNLHYAGRPRSPSPAVGHMADHLRELQQLLADALVNPFNDQFAE